MTRKARKSTWVEVHRVVLEPGKRAPQVPADTQRVPLEMKSKGFLARDACVGEEVEILTPAGRLVTGILVSINPAYTHQFGPPIPALCAIGGELREMLRRRRG